MNTLKSFSFQNLKPWHFFVFLLFCGIISVSFYYSEIRNHSNNGASSNTFVDRNKRRTHLFVNDNSIQENNQDDDTTGSCHLNFSVADTENAHSFFTRELLKSGIESYTPNNIQTITCLDESFIDRRKVYHMAAG